MWFKADSMENVFCQSCVGYHFQYDMFSTRGIRSMAVHLKRLPLTSLNVESIIPPVRHVSMAIWRWCTSEMTFADCGGLDFRSTFNFYEQTCLEINTGGRSLSLVSEKDQEEAG